MLLNWDTNESTKDKQELTCMILYDVLVEYFWYANDDDDDCIFFFFLYMNSKYRSHYTIYYYASVCVYCIYIYILILSISVCI